MKSGLTGTNLIGWGVLLVLFVGLAEYEPTSQLAIAFAWLLALSILLGLGPDAIGNLTAILGSGGAGVGVSSTLNPNTGAGTNKGGK